MEGIWSIYLGCHPILILQVLEGAGFLRVGSQGHSSYPNSKYPQPKASHVPRERSENSLS